jgi:NADH-quinone oxidoreductase subunit K
MPGSEAVLNNYLIVGALLFTLGLVGFLARRNLIVMFLCAELMLQGVSLTLVAFSEYHGSWGGQVFAIFSLALAAAEAGIALALFVVLFRRRGSLDVSIWQDLREADQPPVPDDSAGEAPPPEAVWPHLTPAGELPPGSPHEPRRTHKPPAPEPVGAAPAGAPGGNHGH